MVVFLDDDDDDDDDDDYDDDDVYTAEWSRILSGCMANRVPSLVVSMGQQETKLHESGKRNFPRPGGI